MATRRDILRWTGSAVGAALSAKFGEPARAVTVSPEVEATTPSVTTVWAEAIARARYEDLRPEVVKRAKLCILDNIGVMAHTSTLKDSMTFLERPLKIGGPADATVWGLGVKLPLETATACNASHPESRITFAPPTSMKIQPPQAVSFATVRNAGVRCLEIVTRG